MRLRASLQNPLLTGKAWARWVKHFRRSELVGLPPFCVFASKFLILWGGIEAAQLAAAPWIVSVLRWGALAIFVMVITIVFAAMVGHLNRLLFGEPIIRSQLLDLTPKSQLVQAAGSS
jgi:formate hydrogenlyase subunit 3/multisubunit Na+/H+ antiporter MnhD subunit